jgi:hypothetical protein
METILAGRAEQFNLFWMDMKCIMWSENKNYKMIKAEKNIWTNIHKKIRRWQIRGFYLYLMGVTTTYFGPTGPSSGNTYIQNY